MAKYQILIGAELAGLRRLRDALACRELTISRSGVDVTATELQVLDNEIRRLERALLRAQGEIRRERKP